MTQEGPEILGEVVAEALVHLVLAEVIAHVLDRVLGREDLDAGSVQALQRGEAVLLPEPVGPVTRMMPVGDWSNW